MANIVFHLPNTHDLKNVLESVLLTAKGAEKVGAWDIICSEYTPAITTTAPATATATATAASTTTSTTSPSPLWRCTSSTYPNVCCFVHNNHVLTGPYNEKDRSRSLEQFIIHDKSDRYKESAIWSVQGFAISLAEHLFFRIGTISLGGTTEVYDGICVSLECNDPTASRDECLQRMAVICTNIEEALKQHYTEEAAALAIPSLSNFDRTTMSQLQTTYHLPESSPMRYEALQVLDILQTLRKE